MAFSNQPPNMARSRSTNHLKTTRIHFTCTHSEEVPESFGRFLLEKRPEQSTYSAVPDLREAPLRCCCNGMENEEATWRSGCKRWCVKPRFLRWISYSLLFEVANPVPWVFALYLHKLLRLSAPTTSNTTTFGLDSWQMQNINKIK